ncbi:ABC transporter ATP-binding protein [Pseudoneobacillus sp. C159]
MKNTVVIDNLLVKTKTKTLLKLDSLAIESGKRYVLIGPSGAGKSTLLKSIATLQAISAGEVKLFEEKIRKKNLLSLRKRMVYVAQHEVLFQGDVEYNVGLGLQFRKMPKAERQSKISSILALLGLEDYEKRNVESLSGGEIQRVALARGLVLEPDLLLLDEPTANLDPFNVQMIEKAIIHYCEQNGATLMLATHNMNQAKRIGQHGLFIQQGELAESGPLPELINNPTTKQLQDFLEWA